MIYVQENDFETQFKLLEYLAGKGGFIVIGWQYPEINKSPVPFFPTSMIREDYKAVTTYANGIIANHTAPVKAKPSMLAYLVKFNEKIQKAFDSFCLYKNGRTEWFACTIGHEGMCLVRDDSLLQELTSKGFNASTNKPSWW